MDKQEQEDLVAKIKAALAEAAANGKPLVETVNAALATKPEEKPLPPPKLGDGTELNVGDVLIYSGKEYTISKLNAGYQGKHTAGAVSCNGDTTWFDATSLRDAEQLGLKLKPPAAEASPLIGKIGKDKRWFQKQKKHMRGKVTGVLPSGLLELEMLTDGGGLKKGQVHQLDPKQFYECGLESEKVEPEQPKLRLHKSDKNGLSEGDMVVLKKFAGGEFDHLGFGPDMDKLVGKSVPVTNLREDRWGWVFDVDLGDDESCIWACEAAELDTKPVSKPEPALPVLKYKDGQEVMVGDICKSGSAEWTVVGLHEDYRGKRELGYVHVRNASSGDRHSNRPEEDVLVRRAHKPLLLPDGTEIKVGDQFDYCREREKPQRLEVAIIGETSVGIKCADAVVWHKLDGTTSWSYAKEIKPPLYIRVQVTADPKPEPETVTAQVEDKPRKVGKRTYYMSKELTMTCRVLLNQSNRSPVNVKVIGKPGCGKSDFAKALAENSARDYFEFNAYLAGDDPNNWWGTRDLDNGKITIHHSSLWRGFETPNSVVLIDEWNRCVAPMRNSLISLLDHRGWAEIPKYGVLKRAPGVIAIFTANERGSFTGTFTSDSAHEDRMHQTILLDYSPHEKEILLEQAPGLTDKDADHLLSVARKSRELFAKGMLSEPIGTRRLISAALALSCGATMELALSNAIWNNYFDPSDLKTLEEAGLLTAAKAAA